MNTKKFAIRGLVILAVVVALCMFFSGTIRTIATAKVRITRAQQGKMRQQISLSGELTFLEEEEVFVDASGQSLQVTKVNVLPGYQVAAGDVIFEAEIADYEKTMSDKRAEYESSYMELMDLEQANGSTRLSRTDTLWAEAYYALSDATQAALEKQIAMETLLVHRDMAEAFLPSLAEAMGAKGVQLRGDEATRALIACAPATEADWDTEYLDLILSIRVVDSLEAAIDHINRHGSHHTDCIVTGNDAAAAKFLQRVDSAGVYRNVSTRFADGFVYGFGAEVGIATGKIHARGPMGLEGLTTYKYKLLGEGQLLAEMKDGTRRYTHRDLDQACPL